MSPYRIAFLAGLASLAFEITLVRMLAFFLGNGMDFLAIPLALLGLAIGSIYAHFRYRGPPEQLVRTASAALPVVLLGSLIAFFALFDLAFSSTHITFANPAVDAGRLVAYGAILLPPFAAFGALFAALFTANADRVGQLYAADLAGAAAGCVVAPVVLTWFGLPATLVVVVATAALLLLLDPTRPARLRAAVAGGLVLVAIGAGAGVLFTEHPDLLRLANTVLRKGDTKVSSVAVRWNEIARTDLLRTSNPEGSAQYFVVQDNGLSNVNVQRYDPAATRERKARHHGAAWAMGRRPTRILTVFAGAGRDLIEFERLSEGTADLTGVELNPAVVSLARRVTKLNLDAFLTKPNVHLIIQEGRDFLDHDTGRYDLIYVANNGAVHASRTGHTRKFLDTAEAMAEYLEHLAPGGVMQFVNQPIAEKIPAFDSMLPGGIADKAIVFGRRDHPDIQTLLVAPAGFTAVEVQGIRALIGDWTDGTKVLYAPPLPGISRAGQVTLDKLSRRMVTDDQPFTRSLELSRLRPIPGEKDLKDRAYVSSWVKVFTVILFATLSGIAGLLVMRVGRGVGRVPLVWVLYLLLTGIGYMCVEIGLIARTELFVGKPLYAVAINLAVFLVASAAGSWLADRRPATMGPLPIALATVLATGWGHLATGWLTAHALSLPLVLKALGVAVAVGPAGMALGTFYPYAVSHLVRAGRAQAVPATYALTTLSSVLGSAFAMTAIIELGFSRVIALGAGCYVAACVLAFVSERWPRRANVVVSEAT